MRDAAYRGQPGCDAVEDPAKKDSVYRYEVRLLCTMTWVGLPW